MYVYIRFFELLCSYFCCKKFFALLCVGNFVLIIFLLQCFLNAFNTLTLKPIFSKTITFFKKLEYRFLVESTNIENATFPYKAALSEANVKTNGMGSTKRIYHKERSFANNCLIFSKILIQFKNFV